MKEFLQLQADIPVIKKDQDNPFFKSKYATLEGINSVVMPLLSKHGFVVSHSIKTDERPRVTTIIIHNETKESLVSEFPLTGSDPQKLGSCVTYGKRYNLTALLNLSIEDDVTDDDGNLASGNNYKPESTRPSEKQIQFFYKLAKEQGWTGVEAKEFINNNNAVQVSKMIDSMVNGGKNGKS